MRKIAFLLLTTLVIPFVFAQKITKKAEYTHDFPPEMHPEVKKAYVADFEKGKVLYSINCSKCHDSLSKGVLCMPAYTKEHLAKYELRVQNQEHEASLTEMRVNAEELQQIMIFLTYYKRVDKEGKVKK